ncbi:MAG: sensor histidine kinase [Lachnospiraceae bacterium]|nr:sensor histidine kinase [Lachnospiraceae bacterium]
MNFSKYLKDKVFEIISGIVGAITVLWLMIVFESNIVLTCLVTFLFVLIPVIWFVYDFNRKAKFYNNLADSARSLDKAYLVLETLEEPGFLEGKLIFEILYDIDKSMAENVALYTSRSKDFSEYIEMWIHEVKLPLSAISLKLHNLLNAYETEADEAAHATERDTCKKLLSEIGRIEEYVNQVLYYARSGCVEKDCHISKIKLSDIIHETAMNLRDSLLDNNVDLLVESEVRSEDGTTISTSATEVNTDQKWLVFVLGQLISNSIKYKKDEESYVKIYAKRLKDASGRSIVRLVVMDNGIGIPGEDIGRVFERSFTGQNGKSRSKSTGMGLYIVKGLCERLGHTVSIESEQGSFTKVNIDIIDNDYYEVL